MFPASFDVWRHFLDMRLLQYAGVTSWELPIPEQAWRNWCVGGWGAQTVAELIAGFIMGEGVQCA
jgi:hypothetical protein